MAVDRTPILKRCRSLDMDPVVLGVNKKSRRKLTRANRKVSEYGLQLRILFDPYTTRKICCSNIRIPTTLQLFFHKFAHQFLIHPYHLVVLNKSYNSQDTYLNEL